ncbi:hypothetical protein HaLaN_25444 [Haematococcus lacustris]|uniref:Uncharacterized protein n=1 Tax=Haematococcus lacustris TaxID=44745 RepID=A0A6A0A4F8_HAELA|nr:hypothetical protein HaLaN_25444 [Haematococcus lacustris]
MGAGTCGKAWKCTMVAAACTCIQAAEPSQPTKGTGKGKGKAAKAKPAPQPGSAEHAAHWGEQVAAAGAVLLARAGEAASQGQGVSWPGLQAAARQATTGPAAAAAC